MAEINEEIQRLLKQVVEHFDKEDRPVRERQIRLWRRLKLYWEGFQRVWWSETAHDWRVYDEQLNAESYSDQSFYDKPVNVFRAYLESIIAALSITIPAIKCYPDDADDPLDVSTAKAGDNIANLIMRHNDVSLLWLKALFIWCTEGMTACYTYPKEDESYGTYEDKEYKDEEQEVHQCPSCGQTLDPDLFAQAKNLSENEEDEFQPGDDDAELHNLIMNEDQIVCPSCAVQLDPDLQKTKIIVTRLVGVTKKAKSRICMEVYGGLNIKIPNYARTQAECPYLIYAYETHYSNIIDKYEVFKKGDFDLKTTAGGMYDPYERWGRLNPQYVGEYPVNNVTVRNCWLRSWAFNVLQPEESKQLKKKFPDGVKVVMVNDQFAEAEDESLDDCWTLTQYPLSDYLHHDPAGMTLVNIQDITNELISLVIQTIEHGISQTFADPAVLNFDQYNQMEVAPGMVIPTKAPRTGQKIADGFFETRTATLSAEVLPFSQKIQEFGQLVSGALPSLFGGMASEGGKTAAEYSMSRSQALQRLQNNWKVLLVWWKQIFGKAIDSFIKEQSEDERYVAKDELGKFYNVFIRKAETLGKIGSIELEANENLPLTWGQRKDVIMQILQGNNPMLLNALMDPENINMLKDAIGLDDFVLPGEDDRQKQYEEIQQLINSEPIEQPAVDPTTGQPAMDPTGNPIPEEQPSVVVDQDVDNHEIEAAICRHWLVSDAGRLAKVENPMGYRNVLLHMKQHLMFIQQAQMAQAGPGGNPPSGPNNGQPQNAAVAAPPQQSQTGDMTNV